MRVRFSLLATVVVVGCEKRDDDALTPAAGPPTLVAASSATVEVTWPDVVFAPDGTLWVSWTEIDENDIVDVFVVRSDDAGATFGSKIAVDDVDKLFLGGVRQPVLAADEERVAIAVGGGSYIDSSILLYVADADSPVFEGQVLDEAQYADGGIGNGEVMTLVDQPEVAFDTTGQLLLNWKQGTFNESFQLVLAREADGFSVNRLEDGIRGEPCECCTTDFVAYPDGELLMAFRNNDLNLREIFLAAAPSGGAFGDATFQVSTTGWVIGGCPLEGPVMTPAPDDVLVATWCDASLDDNYQWWAVSRDHGRTWTPSALVHPDVTDSMTWPSLVTAHDGTVWSSVMEIAHRTLVVSTTDLGATFVAHDADSPGGPLFYAELAAGPDGVGMIGVTEAGELWYLAFSDG